LLLLQARKRVKINRLHVIKSIKHFLNVLLLHTRCVTQKYKVYSQKPVLAHRSSASCKCG